MPIFPDQTLLMAAGKGLTWACFKDTTGRTHSGDDKAMTEECCPKFDPGPWDGTVQEWTDKMFIRGHVRTFMYIPLNFKGAITRMMQQVQGADATTPDYLCLSDHTSWWNMDLLLAVDRVIPGAENITLSGKMICKAYEGPFKDTGKWCANFETYARENGYHIRKMYMWYTTCPQCAKKNGKNPVVILGEVA